MNKIILVTGINGFVGKHLSRELYSRGFKVIGVGHQDIKVNPEIESTVSEYYQCDVTAKDHVNQLPLSQVSAVINLAGLANVGASFDSPELYMEVNVKVLSVLGESLYNSNPQARMIAVSSGALYDPNQEMPLREDSKTVKEGSPYAKSKLAMEDTAKKLRELGQDCIVARPFNHIGPGQGLGFLIPDLADKLRRIDSENPTISAGNLKTVRDYTDVRDISKAYADLATASNLNHDLYNVCSGNGKSGEDIVKSLCKQMGVNFSELSIEVDPSLIRPTDPARIVGDSSLLSRDTGWQPTVPLDKTVQDIVEGLWTGKS